MVQSVTSKINEEEAALYDRQIRLWGLDAQIRLRNASVLLAGLNGLGAEVAKNLMLAGLKSLTLMDDNVVSEKDIKSQFFLSRDSVGQNRAEASLTKCQLLNPLVKLTADASQFDSKAEDFYKQFDLVCIIMDAFDEKVIKINEICRQNGVKFTCGGCFGWFGFSFNDFLDHEFAEEVNVTEVENESEPSPKKFKTNSKEETQTIKKMVEQFVSFGDALKIDIKPENIQKWKKVLSGYLILQILRKYSEKFRRRPSKLNKTEDVSELETMKNQLVSELVEATKEKIDIPNFNAELLLDDLSPVCAIVGGILAQELIKAVSNKDRPLSNIFFYNGMDFTGIVGKFPIC